MTILITGGAGFIGSNFVKWLHDFDKSLSIINLDALTYSGNLENIKELLDSPRHQFIKGNICDPKLAADLVGKVDMVLNLAAESHVDRSIDGPKDFIETNINGTFNLLEATRKHNPKIRFVQISTDEVYGTLGTTGKFTEETPLAPNSPYSSSKASADLIARAYHHTYGMDIITTRCSNNYGAYQFPEKLIPLMIFRATKNESLPVYGDGKNIRDWIHVRDHNRGVWAAALKGKSGEVYNLGSNNEWENIKIVKELLKILEKPESLITYVKDRPGHDKRYAIDSSKAHKELGWSPEVSFDEGLRETVNWYLTNTEWLKSVTSGEYQKFFEKWYKN